MDDLLSDLDQVGVGDVFPFIQPAVDGRRRIGLVRDSVERRLRACPGTDDDETQRVRYSRGSPPRMMHLRCQKARC